MVVLLICTTCFHLIHLIILDLLVCVVMAIGTIYVGIRILYQLMNLPVFFVIVLDFLIMVRNRNTSVLN